MEIRVGIIAAVTPELNAIKEKMDAPCPKKIFELEFWEGRIAGVGCVVVECGVGKVNAARVAQIMIDNYQLNALFNVGTAGALDPNLAIGDIVISETLVQHDYDRTALGNALAHIPNLKSAYIASDETLARQCRHIMQCLSQQDDVSGTIYYGTIVTGDVFKITAEKRDELRANFNALCVEMEGAAIAHVCELCHIPFVAIRSISNAISGSSMDEDEFYRFRSTASERCADFVQAYCEQLPSFKKEDTNDRNGT